jgi:hypothetical protein
MSKVTQIQRITGEAKMLVDEVYRDLVEATNSYNLLLEEFEATQQSVTLSSLNELQESLDGMKHLPPVPSEPQIAQEDFEPLKPLEVPNPPEVNEPKIGLFKAKFWGFMTFLAVVVGFAVGGAVMRHIDLGSITPENWRQNLEEAFGFFSSLITRTPDSGAAIGIVAALGVGALLGYLVYWMLANTAAAKNLSKAKEIFARAKEWSEEQRAFIEKLKKMGEFLQEGIYALQAERYFGDEFGARVKRARFFEGDDYEAMSPVAKDEVATAQRLQAALRRMTDLKLYATSDYEVAPDVKAVFKEARKEVDGIKKRIYG